MSPLLTFLLRVSRHAMGLTRGEEIQGDLLESYARRRARHGRLRAELACLRDLASVVFSRPTTRRRARVPRVRSALSFAAASIAVGLAALIVVDQHDPQDGWLVLAVLLEGALWTALLRRGNDGLHHPG